MQTAVQLYSLRAVDEPLYRSLERVAAAGFDGVEFVGFGDATTGALAETLDRHALGVAGVHVPYRRIETEFAETIAGCRSLGTDSLVVPHFDASSFADERSIERAARHLSDLGTMLGDYGLRVAYHNHDHEFGGVEVETAPGSTDGFRTTRRAFECLVEWTDAVDFEFDVGWAVAAGVDPVSVIQRYGERISRVHLKDVVVDENAPYGGRPVDLGTGRVDVEGCLAAAREANVEWVIYEHDDPSDPIASLQRASELFRASYRCK